MFFNLYEERYKKMGLTDFRLKNLDDIEAIYNVNCRYIDGVERLQATSRTFRRFLLNFYNGWGLEARETIRPISVKYLKDKVNGVYLRFDYWMYGERHWLHVKNENTWY